MGDKVMYDCRKFYVTSVRLYMHPRYGSAMVDSDRYALLLAVTICKMNIFKPCIIMYNQICNIVIAQSPILLYTKQYDG